MINKSSLIQRTAATEIITINAPGPGKYICITSLDAEADTAAGDTVRVTSGAVIWQHGILQNESLFKSWEPKLPLIGAENTAVAIEVLGAGDYTMNVSGYVTP